MKVFRLLLVPFALLVVWASRLLYPWKLVRFGELWSGRIGHLIANTECYLCEKEARKTKSYDIFFPIGGVCNEVIYAKYKKLLHIWPSWLVVVLKVNRLFSDWERHSVSDAQFGRDIYNLYKKPHIGLTKKEEKRGQELLRDLGIPEGSKWVCLIVRDGSYLKNLPYHDYRNSDIDDYKAAAIMLAGRGYYVIRMGSVVEKPFDTGLRFKVIDYATSHRTEFGDLYLGANCTFCISTGTGFDEIPHAFGRPVVYVNFAPLEYAPTFSRGLLIWKHHIRNGKRMSPEEIYATAGQFTFSHLFAQAGITLEDNSPQEIVEAVLEMANELESWPFFALDHQVKFWKTFPRRSSEYNGKPLHGEIRLRIGREFLKGYDGPRL